MNKQLQELLISSIENESIKMKKDLNFIESLKTLSWFERLNLNKIVDKYLETRDKE